MRGAKDWPENTGNATQEFFEQLAAKQGHFQISTRGTPAAGEVVIVPTVERIESGIYAVAWASPTRVAVHLNILVDGQVADELTMNDTVAADLYHPSFNQRLADCMQDVAEYMVGYLDTRTGAKK